MERRGVVKRGSEGTAASASGSFPTTDPLPARLFPPLPTGVQWGLERTARALAEIGDPHLRYPSIHIGGTNGKGSVAATLAAVLGQMGLRTGLYTSPHLCSFRERFQVDGRALSEVRLLASAEELRGVYQALGLTFFEATTVLAFHSLARAQVDVAVVEVGLGGRLDATNVIVPEAAAVTNVALDHSEYLGDTLEEVAGEKAGIMKENVPFVTGEADPRLVELFREAAERKAAPFHRVDPERDVSGIAVGREGTRVRVASETWGELELKTPMTGRHQALNAALAVRVLETLPAFLKPTAEEVIRGIAAVRWPGRMQVVEHHGRVLVLDVAHNPAGALALAASLDELALARPRVLLVGILGDKDWNAMLQPLFRGADEAVLTEPHSAPRERRWDPEDAARRLSTGLETRICREFNEALRMALELSENGTLVITGSHHTVGDAMGRLGIRPLEGRGEPF